MGLGEWERSGWVEKVAPNLRQIKNYLNKGFKDLKTAKAIIALDEERAYTIAYEGMLRAGRGLLLSYGVRPKAKDQHFRVGRMVDEILGKKHRKLTSAFDRMRRKRHKLLYDDTSSTSKTDAKEAINSAKAFIETVITFIKSKQPQLDLF